MEGLSIPIQLISIIGAMVFLVMIFRLIVKGKLREEYSIVWIFCTAVLVFFSVWRRGLHKISEVLGVFYPPSLIFLVGILAIIVFLVHLSVVNSRMHTQLKNLTHEIAYLKQEMASHQATPQPPTAPQPQTLAAE